MDRSRWGLAPKKNRDNEYFSARKINAVNEYNKYSVEIKKMTATL